MMRRFSARLYVAYCSFYVIGTLASMEVPFVSYQPVTTSEHMAALGVFGLLQIVAFIELLRSHLPSKQFQTVFNALVATIFAVGVAALVVMTMTGIIAPWTGRLYSLWDTGYAKIHIPIIASVSEHQPTAWTSWFFDLNWLIFMFPAGVYFCFRELKDEHIFVIIYSIFASYFASVMVRLMLTLTPIVAVAAAIALSYLLDAYLKNPVLEDSSETNAVSPTPVMSRKESNSATTPGQSRKDFATPTMSRKEARRISEDTAAGRKKGSDDLKKKKSSSSPMPFEVRFSVVAVMFYACYVFMVHCTWVTSMAYSSPSVVLASRNNDGSQYIIDDFREAYYWLRKNTPKDTKVMSWWDYGYQLAGMADRTTLVDNNTWNNTHIATVGKAMASTEEVSYPILRKHDVDYVLVIFGGVLGYSGDDINKFLWMIRIAQGIWPSEVRESDFYTDRGEYRVDDQASKTMKESLMYKMCYYRYGDIFGGNGVGVDRVRGAQVSSKDIKLETLEEAYSTQHFIVRLYKVKKPDNLGRPLITPKSTITAKRGKRVSGQRK